MRITIEQTCKIDEDGGVMREFYEDGVERHISQTKTDARIASEEIRRLRAALNKIIGEPDISKAQGIAHAALAPEVK